jgi:rubrerythrin
MPMKIGPDCTLEEFVAHALAVEFEAARTLRDLKAAFGERGEDQLASLCGKLADLEQEHYERLEERSRGLALPAVDYRLYAWLESHDADCCPRDMVFHIATPRALLEIALKAEQRAAGMFGRAAGYLRDAGARELAAQLAQEEGEHVRWVLDALARTPRDETDWETMLAEGGGPCLALGAERRMRRDPTPGAS